MYLSHQLIQAAYNGDIPKIRRLHQLGHNLNLACEDDGDLLYHYIWQNNAGQPNGLIELLNLGVRLSNINTHGGTPLVAAVWTQNSEWVRILLEAGMDPNVIAFVDEDEISALSVVLDDYCDCGSDIEIQEMRKNEELIRSYGGREHCKYKPISEQDGGEQPATRSESK